MENTSEAKVAARAQVVRIGRDGIAIVAKGHFPYSDEEDLSDMSPLNTRKIFDAGVEKARQALPAGTVIRVGSAGDALKGMGLKPYELQMISISIPSENRQVKGQMLPEAQHRQYLKSPEQLAREIIGLVACRAS